MGEDHLFQVIIHVLLGLAVFSYLEYCIRTAQAPQMVNRRAKIICAVGLTIAVIGMWTVLLDPQVGVVLTLVGNLTAVGSMIWLESQAPKRKKSN